jgi:TPR repeat protein
MAQSVSELHIAAEQGDASAQNKLANIYPDGIVVAASSWLGE